MTIKRYDIHDDGVYVSMEPREAGRYVKHEDHLAALTAIERAAYERGKAEARHLLASSVKEAINNVLLDYRQTEVSDEDGNGYPLVDALTLEGHSIDMGIREIESIADTIADALLREREPVEPVVTVTGDRSEIDRLVAVLRKGRHGSDISHNAADWIERLSHAEFEAVVKLNSTPPDALALVAAAYRDAAEQPAGIAEALKPIAEMRAVDKDKCEAVIALYESMAETTRARTPADAQAALTAIELAAYERGVRDAAEKCDAVRNHEDTTEDESVGALCCALEIRALLTQEGR